MQKGKLYRFRHSGVQEPSALVYIGHNWSGDGYWHQFTLVGEHKVWSELPTSSLDLIEELPTEVEDVDTPTDS